MIQRQIQTRLLEEIGFYPAVAIVGPRQVGKTTLAHYLETVLNRPTLFLDLQEPQTQKIFEADDITFLQAHTDKTIIIDEIQLRPQLFSVLRPLIDKDRRAGRFILLGSSSPTLMRHAAETLAGRIHYSELTPFSLLEAHTIATQQEHWFFGGFPEAIKAKGTRFAQQWLGNYIRDFVYRDLRTLGYDLNVESIKRLLMMLASVQSGLLNISDLSRSLNLSRPTLNKHIEILEQAFLIDVLPPYSTNISKRLVKSPKVYIRDTGILHTLLEIRSYEHLLSHISLGASWEGYVIEQIRRCAVPEWQFFFYRTQSGAEADLFAISPTGYKICIEIKHSLAPSISKGFYESVKDLSPDASYVIIPEGQQYITKDLITVIPLMSFLGDILPGL
ncbi:MAG TPA: ATPase [Runella sp.]|nr:ATPase [Runella sp.]